MKREQLSCKEKLRDWDMTRLGKEQLQGPPDSSPPPPTRWSAEGGDRLFPAGHSKRMRHNRQKLKQESYRMDIMKSSFPMRTVGPVTQRGCAVSVLAGFKDLAG